MTPIGGYSTRPLTPDTWDDFAHLVDANNGSGVVAGAWVSIPRVSVRGAPSRGTARPSRPMYATERSIRFSSMTGRTASAGASTGRQPSCRTSRTRRSTPRSWTNCPTGGSDASSPARGAGARGRPELLWAVHWPPSRKRVAGSSRRTPNRSKGADHSVAPTSPRDRPACTRSSASSESGG